MSPWTDEDERRLREMYAANVTEEAIMATLDKTVSSYRMKCRQLGLVRRSFDRPRYPYGKGHTKRLKKGASTLPPLASEG